MTMPCKKALRLAAEGDISAALRLSLSLPGEEGMDRLSGLCLLALGYPESAAEHIPCEEDAQAQRRLIEALGQTGAGWFGYRKALRLLREYGRENVRLLLIQGCLHARRGKRERAEAAFLRALAIDRGNREARRLLEGLR